MFGVAPYHGNQNQKEKRRAKRYQCHSERDAPTMYEPKDGQTAIVCSRVAVQILYITKPSDREAQNKNRRTNKFESCDWNKIEYRCSPGKHGYRGNSQNVTVH